jgi:hypothetical protein
MKQQAITFHSTKDIKPLLKQIQNLIMMRLTKDANITYKFLLVCGLLNKTYELTESAIWSIQNDRPQTTTFMLRGLYETLAFTYYAKDKILKAANKEDYDKTISELLLGTKKPGAQYPSVNILTCIDKASKTFTELRKNYDELSELVHPNSASHFYVAVPDDKKEMTISLRIPFYQFKESDKAKSLNQIGECCFHIIRLCSEML